MIKQKKGSRYRVWIGCTIAAIITSTAVFMAMLQVEKNLLSEYEKDYIWVAGAEIPRGLFLDEHNYADYVICKEMDKKLIPETAFAGQESVVRGAPVYAIEAGTILTSGMFEEKEAVWEDMECPVIAGFKAEDLYQMAGGVLRRGDRINIYSVKEDEGASLLWKDIYVQDVFDSSGYTVDHEDNETAVMRINIYLDEKDVERFYTGLESGSLRVVKLCK